MGLPEFDKGVIRDLATEMSYDRGEEYADYGAVPNLVSRHRRDCRRARGRAFSQPLCG
jgi:hypothetical protein